MPSVQVGSDHEDAGVNYVMLFFSHSIIINNLHKDKTLTTQEAVNPWNGTASPGLRATAKPRTHSWKIEPSKKGL